MLDCFISYSSHDEDLAQSIHSELASRGLNVFMAGISLSPGVDWSPEIRRQLDASPRVLFLASEAACRSPYVQQELGMALNGGKTLIPVVWDMPPDQLPGWVSEKHAIDLRDASVRDVREQVASIAETIRAEKRKGWLKVGGVILGVIALAGEQ